MDMPKFEALTLNDDTSHTVESPDSELPQKYLPPKYRDDISFPERQAEKEYEENQAQSLLAQGQYTYASKEEIAQNARKCIAEEAFRRYIESQDDLQELEYVFDELLHQCFYVEHHFVAFYHFNFTAKIKKRGSADWTSVRYFAEVKSIRGIKHYVCYPLDPDENGQCYACPKKGMQELRHPVGIFPSSEFRPIIGYFEDTDSDDEFYPTMRGSESDDDMS